MAIDKESKGFGMPWEDEYGHTFSEGQSGGGVM
jgi:hypothetical protein